VVVELRGYKGGTYFFRGGFHPMFFEGLKGIFLSFFLPFSLPHFLSFPGLSYTVLVVVVFSDGGLLAFCSSSSWITPLCVCDSL